MKRALSILAFLSLLVTSIYAQKYEIRTFKNRFEKSREPNSLHREITSQKPEAYFKSSQSTKQLDSCIRQGWDKTIGQWMITDYKSKYAYDAMGKTLQELEVGWDMNTSKWIVYWKGEYTYNADGKMTQNLYFNWNENTSYLTASEKSVFTYNGNGYMTQELYYEWEGSTSQWIRSSKEEYSYDSNWKIIQIIDYEWEEATSQWIKRYKEEYTYDLNNRLISDAYLRWDSNTGQWKYYSEDDKYVYTYNVEGKITEELQFGWDETFNQWNVEGKTNYTYNSNGYLIQRLGYGWDKINNQWVTDYRREFKYDASGNNTWIDSEWNKTTNQWIIDCYNDKRVMTYDYSYSFSDLILPLSQLYYDPTSIYNGVYFHNKLETIIDYNRDNASSNWVESNKTTYFYSNQISTSVSEIIKEEVFIYPNPVSEYISFSISSNYSHILFELFDLQGQKIMAKEVSSSEIVNVEWLKNGLYFYNLFIGGKRHFGKLLKK